ncbi:MAG: hypothetical protein ACRD6W_04760 [Nitrososphaerales archaeon]
MPGYDEFRGLSGRFGPKGLFIDANHQRIRDRAATSAIRFASRPCSTGGLAVPTQAQTPSSGRTRITTSNISSTKSTSAHRPRH